MKLPLDEIRLDGGTQPRESLNADCINRYRQDMCDGVQYDPIEVVYDGTDYWCWDGFHRCRAASLAQLSEIDVHVTQGTLSDAQWFAAGANKRHGLPRSKEDKARAVRTALTHPQGAGLSDHTIAEHVGVSQPFVGKIRKEMAATENDYQSTKRTGRDGRRIDVANIRTSNKKRRNSKPSRRVVARITQPTRTPNPMRKMTALSMPYDPFMGAMTLIEVFDVDYLRTLVNEISKHLKELHK